MTNVVQYEIQNKQIKLPVAIRDASAWFAIYIIDKAAAQKLFPECGLSLYSFIPGKACFVLGVVQYRDTDLGAYNEVVSGFLVKDKLQSFFSPFAGLYVHWMPVTQSFTRDAGEMIWGYPKTIEVISIETSGVVKQCQLVSKQETVFTLTLPEFGRLSVNNFMIHSYTFHDGVLRKIPAKVSLKNLAIRYGGSDLQLGEHNYAYLLRELGLPKKPLITISAEHISAEFFPSDEI